MSPLYSFISLGVAVVVVGYVVYLYNTLVRRRFQMQEAWSDIEIQLKRRYDLIPNLLETVKGYASHEKQLFEKVTEARAKAIQATTVKDHNKADNMLTETLKSLFAVAENYPDLKANVNFLELQRELTDTEDKIQAARRFYNSVVLEYNSMVATFPSNIVANQFGFKKTEFFDVPEIELETVKVKF